MAATGLLIVTPIKLYRDGIAHFLEGSEEFSVLGTCEVSDAVVQTARDVAPDVILLDMALQDSRSTARALHEALPDIPIVALAVHESEGDVVACAEVGVLAYVPGDGTLDDLAATIRRAARGEALCPPQIAAGLFRRVATLWACVADPSEQGRGKARLTAREEDVLALLEQGLSNQQIARRLSIEVATVKNHVHAILEKTESTSRSEVAARARHRLGRPD